MAFSFLRVGVLVVGVFVNVVLVDGVFVDVVFVDGVLVDVVFVDVVFAVETVDKAKRGMRAGGLVQTQNLSKNRTSAQYRDAAGNVQTIRISSRHDGIDLDTFRTRWFPSFRHSDTICAPDGRGTCREFGSRGDHWTTHSRHGSNFWKCVPFLWKCPLPSFPYPRA